jgi:hypothetical protein
MATSSIRWGRVVLGGFLAELILIVLVIPIRAFGGPESAVTFVAVAGSFVVFVPVAWWLCRSAARPILHGALMGAAAAVIYLIIHGATAAFVADSPQVPFIYYVAHVLKVAGGAAGGWFARQRAPAERWENRTHA